MDRVKAIESFILLKANSEFLSYKRTILKPDYYA